MIAQQRNWVLALAAALPVWAVMPAHADMLGVATAKVQPGNATHQAELEGVLEAVRQSTVAAQANGRVTALYAKAGDAVKAGQLLATIDDREAQAAGQQSTAQNEQADAMLRSAKQQLDRSKDLRAQGFVSQSALDGAQAQYDAALAQKNQAKAASTQTRLAQGYTRVMAPFDGYISSVAVEVGDLAVPGRALMTVYAPQPLRAVVQVPASRLPAVLQAKTLQLQVGGDSAQWVQAASKTVVPSADPVAQTTELRLNLAAKDAAGLVPGQQARLRFESATSTSSAAVQALQVPAKAIVQRGELTAVYVWTGKAFSLRPVRVGQSSAGNVAVLSGLRAGDEVALDPVRAANARAQ